MTWLKAFLFTLLTAAFLGAGAGVMWLAVYLQQPGPLATEKLIYIAPGRSVKGISQQLIDEGVLRDDWPFLAAARWKNTHRDLKAGEYMFTAHINILDILSLLKSGRTHQRKITIPEGLMSIEIVDMLKAEPALDGEIAEVPPEGSLLPQTYHFSLHDKRHDLIARMQRDMQDQLKQLWDKRGLDLPIATPQEAVTLASIVEKETAVKSERPRVAGVFINRLKKKIPLQTDPTVIYAITQGKEKIDRPLTLQDLKEPSPYNTYTVQGLPPGPIANPGIASLSATLHPEENEFFYFVADGTGGHAFAKTLKEHNANVKRWREIQKKAK